MLYIRSKSLFVFSVVFVLIFTFTISVDAQKKKSVKKPPTLKPGVTSSAKAKAKPPAAPEKKSDSAASTKIATQTAAEKKTDSAASTKTAAQTAPEKKPDSAAPAKTAAAQSAAEKKPDTTAAAKAEPKKTPEKKSDSVATVKAKAKKTVRKKPAGTASAKVKPQITPEKKAVAAVDAAPEKVWIPPVTVAKIKSDINGKTIADVPSEETGDGTMNWLFANNQPKEIEILSRNASGNSLVVEARVSAKKSRANFDDSVDTLRGVARLHYERGGGNWELRRIDNVSLRHGDTSALSGAVSGTGGRGQTLQVGASTYRNPGPALTPTPTPSAPAQPPVDIISSGMTVPIPAGKYRSYSFRVDSRAVVTGRFQAQGGAQNDIEAYILDYDGFINWTNNHSAPAYYNSGRLTVGNIRAPLAAGTYYLVFSNRYSAADDKTVEANIQLRTDAATVAGIESDGGGYNGAGVGTVNIVRRVYAPSANPAPAYTPQPAPDPRDTLNTVAANTVPPATIKPVISAVSGYASEQVLADTFEVQSRKYQAFPFTVRPGGMVKGTFSVSGGGDRNIEAFIMTANQYDRWSSSGGGVADYSSGRVTNGGISRILQPGDYYVVFSNYYSMRDDKTIQAEIHIEYLPR